MNSQQSRIQEWSKKVNLPLLQYYFGKRPLFFNLKDYKIQPWPSFNLPRSLVNANSFQFDEKVQPYFSSFILCLLGFIWTNQERIQCPVDPCR
jgi:hypothetical protein